MKKRPQQLKPRLRLSWEVIGMIALPVVAVAVVMGAVTLTLSDQIHWGWALFIGLILGVAAVAVGIAEQGHSSIEVMVASALVIFFTLILFPVFQRARHKAERRRAREALRLRSRPALQPKTR